MAQVDVLALQRAIDGYGSSSSSDEDNEVREPEKAEPVPTPAVEGTAEEPAATGETDVHHSESEEEDFDLAAVVAEGKRRQQENSRARLQQHEGGKKGDIQRSLDTSKLPSLPSPEAEIERMAAHVRGETEKRLRQETRRLQQRPEEVTHVSAGGGGGEGEETPHLSRRERWKQKHHATSQKETQQVYVGLPIGKGWHVPLVGIEGKGGYRQSSSSSQQKTGVAASTGSSTDSRAAPIHAAGTAKRDANPPAAPEGKKRSLTVKEREKLKRKKGQSSHATWKPEIWMQLRQQFD